MSHVTIADSYIWENTTEKCANLVSWWATQGLYALMNNIFTINNSHLLRSVTLQVGQRIRGTAGKGEKKKRYMSMCRERGTARMQRKLSIFGIGYCFIDAQNDLQANETVCQNMMRHANMQSRIRTQPTPHDRWITPFLFIFNSNSDQTLNSTPKANANR